MAFIHTLDGYLRNELLLLLPVLFLSEWMLRRGKVSRRRSFYCLFLVSLILTAVYLLWVCPIESLCGFYACLIAVFLQGILLTGGSLFLHVLWHEIGVQIRGEE